MAIDGKLNMTQLIGCWSGSVVSSAVLTRGLFTELTSDERTVRDLNERLRRSCRLTANQPLSDRNILWLYYPAMATNWLHPTMLLQWLGRPTLRPVTER